MSNLDIETIRRLIKNREDKRIDFKRLIDLSNDRNKSRLAQDVVSFANAEGGTIVVGVDDKTRDEIGIPTPLSHDQIIQSITDLTDPPVDISIDSVEKEDGNFFGIISIQRGKAVHRLRKERTVYIRRDGINYIATPEEITQLSDERDYSSRVYLSEPIKLFSSNNGVIMLSKEEQPYRRIKKWGSLEHLAEAPVFLPDFSRWISAPEFGDSQGPLMINYYDLGYLKHQEFIAQVVEVEQQLNSLANYIDFGLQGVLEWSLSSDGTLCCGRGSETLMKAFDNGELGVITIISCGEFRGSNHQRSFLLLMSGYCKSREQGITFVKDREIRMYLSFLPISNGWIRSLFSPVLKDELMPFSLLSYELVHPRLRVWRSSSRHYQVPIKGIIGRYQFQAGDDSQIGAVLADTSWFDPKAYMIQTEWKGGNNGRSKESTNLIFERIDDDRKITNCPIELLNECIISLTNPVPSYEDIMSGNTIGFGLPLIKHLELKVIGHTVHVMGLNASPISSNDNVEQIFRRF
jgi:hypothetical protein